MNTLDLVIIAVIAISAIVAYYKGFLYTVFQTLSTLLSLYLSYRWYQPVKGVLRKTLLYDWLQKIATSNVSGLQGVVGLNEQTQLINNLQLPIPSEIEQNLIQNNNPEIYNLLGADNFKEYVGGYLADFYLSIIAFIVVLFVIRIIMHTLGTSVKRVASLPIIGFFDKWLGLGVGFVKGMIRIWIGTIILALLIAIPSLSQLSTLLSQSTIAKWFYENNLILDIIDQLLV